MTGVVLAEQAKYWMPPEWYPHQRTLMAWPQSQSWGAGWQQAAAAFADVANSISEYEPLLMVVPANANERCRKLLNSAIELLPADYDDAWLRDSGPTFVVDQCGEQLALSWNFNGWGDRFRPWQLDRKLAARVAAHLGVSLQNSSMVLEGGAVHVDGAGSLLVTAQSLFDVKRNPEQQQHELLQELAAVTGCKQLMLLPAGLTYDHTHGHIDELACFTAPGRVLLHAVADDDADAQICRQAELVLQEHAVDIVRLPAPSACYLSGGERLTLSYVNFYIANDLVLVPSFDQPQADANAAAIIAEQFPDRRVLACPALAIAAGGGGIHCITQQQPLTGAVNE